ncbi:MAG: hypothetical protein NC517_05425 [Firmicutes bacterium]|nr:hypothetical protein [Bacillota bacterium]
MKEPGQQGAPGRKRSEPGQQVAPGRKRSEPGSRRRFARAVSAVRQARLGGSGQSWAAGGVLRERSVPVWLSLGM